MDLVKAEMLKYPNAKLMWVQEEPKNMGAWSYTRPRFEATIKKEGSGRTIKLVVLLKLMTETCFTVTGRREGHPACRKTGVGLLVTGALHVL